MKYFIDTEFLEGTQDKKFLGFKYGETKPTIDLISIGIVAEDGREYYAISKEFNLKEAWNRWQPDRESIEYEKEYWIRENVLRPIWKELMVKDKQMLVDVYDIKSDWLGNKQMTYNSLKYLINKYGKTSELIAKEIEKFVRPVQNKDKNVPDYIQVSEQFKVDYSAPQFYGCFADYDWVVFCWLFGKMIDLPKGFPMYCIDLKQELDKKVSTHKFDINLYSESTVEIRVLLMKANFEEKLNIIKSLNTYPKQTNEHHALADAKWNFELYKFIKSL